MLAPWHHVPPQNNTLLNTPNTSTHKKLCMTDMRQHRSSHWTSAKGSILHPRERVLLAPSTSAAFTREEEPLHLPSCPILSYPCCL